MGTARTALTNLNDILEDINVFYDNPGDIPDAVYSGELLLSDDEVVETELVHGDEWRWNTPASGLGEHGYLPSSQFLPYEFGSVF